MFIQPRARPFQIAWMSLVAISLFLGALCVRGTRPGESPVHASALVLWSVLSAALAFRALVYVGHFGTLHPVPSRSQVLTPVLTIAPAAIAAKYLILVLTQIEALRYREILWFAPVVGIIAFTLEYFAGKRFACSGQRRLAFAVMQPHERKQLEAALIEKDLMSFYSIMDGEVLAHSLENPGDIHWIAISRSRVKEFSQSHELLRAHQLGIPIHDFRTLRNSLTGRVHLTDYDSWTFLIHGTRVDFGMRIYREIKPWAERLISLLALVLISPVLTAVALAIRLTDGGPALFRQSRLGFRGHHFEMLKFRSMKINAEAAGPTWACENDPRVTALGRFLRKSRIDELPQLWNVVRGDMSFVGPRPERPEFHEKLMQEIPLFELRLLVRPGITGWSQIVGGYAASIEDSRLKLEYDLFYIQYMSPRFDLVILVRTIMTMLAGREFQPKRQTAQQT